MDKVDLTHVHGLTFEVPREQVVGLIDAKITFLKNLVEVWESVPTNEKYLDQQMGEEINKAKNAAVASAMPAAMAAPPPKLVQLQAIAKKNARNFRVAVVHWETQKKYLSNRDVFTLTQEQLMQLSADQVDALFPPLWPGVTD
jgi:hypothetical protein